MNISVLTNHLTVAEKQAVPTPEEVRAALAVLRRSREAGFAVDGDEPGRDHLAPSADLLNRTYPSTFVPDDRYKATMPDLQNGPASLIKGAKREIQHVGISNFRLPLNYQTRGGETLSLETSVTGSVSLEATKKGINMSRIMRSFYRYEDECFDLQKIASVLESYLHDLESCSARLQLGFRFPMRKRSLRSNLEGYQYYDVAFEVMKDGSDVRYIVHLDFVYSSTCPCSLELAEHARNNRAQIATPHSQRSVARISVEIEDNQDIWIEDLVEHCVDAIPTETQVMVKREDEQAFAELNGSNPIFVEDAVRLICKALQSDKRIGDFRIIASHQESLHSHDAISVLVSGATFDQSSIDPKQFASLYHVG